MLKIKQCFVPDWRNYGYT